MKPSKLTESPRRRGKPLYPEIPQFPCPQAPRMEAIGMVTDLLVSAATEAAQATRRAWRRRGRPRFYGCTLGPGPDTPLWNALADLCRTRLTKYGDKAKLARELGLPRQRLHEILVARCACADAERTLRLLVWLAARTAPGTPIRGTAGSELGASLNA